jgi:heme exporter protein A
VKGPLLEFDAVTLRRGGRLLFEDLSLSVGAGEGLHLSGPNGAGKSSLLRLAAGLLRADRGAIQRAPLAMADDSLALDGELPLSKALHFWSGLSGTADRIDGALEALALAALADVPVRLLSAGQRKRATLARVAASGAPLWLLDEPLNGLDSASAERLGELLARHRAEGGAVVAASHLQLSGEWARMELGR